MSLTKLVYFSVTHTLNFMFNPLHSNTDYKISICPVSTVISLFIYQPSRNFFGMHLCDIPYYSAAQWYTSSALNFGAFSSILNI